VAGGRSWHLFLLSLTGIPPLAGFWPRPTSSSPAGPGRRLADGPACWPCSTRPRGVLYLRVVVYMYMREPAEDAAPLSPGLLIRVGLAVTGRPRRLVFGLFPAILTAVSSAADVLKGLPGRAARLPQKNEGAFSDCHGSSGSAANGEETRAQPSPRARSSRLAVAGGAGAWASASRSAEASESASAEHESGLLRQRRLLSRHRGTATQRGARGR